MDNLHLDQHISHQFNQELELVRSNVLKMGGIVETQLHDAVRALTHTDIELAQQVIDTDVQVNAFEVSIDEECTRIVARRQPAASDLRLVMSVIKTITDLERIGDEVKRVAKMVRAGHSGVISEDISNEIEHMGELAGRMLHNVLDAFARTDEKAALEVIAADTKVDSKYESITRQLISYMMQDQSTIPLIMKILWAARSLERVGDRCQNIAEYIIYLIHGRDVRHTSLDEIIDNVHP